MVVKVFSKPRPHSPIKHDLKLNSFIPFKTGILRFKTSVNYSNKKEIISENLNQQYTDLILKHFYIDV